MKFVYQYRSSDNKSHEGVISAASRDAAYSALKAKGIRPVRVEEAPGFFNKLFGKGKRWAAIVVLGVAAAVSMSVAFRAKHVADTVVSEVLAELSEARDRHQIYGEPALMEELERTGYATIFEDEGDRYLARFAQPGTIVRFSEPDWRASMAKALSVKEQPPIAISAEDAREIRELKQIVLGMRDELKTYLSDGVGTPTTFVRRLEERQARELQIYNQAKADLAKEKNPDAYSRVNDSLREGRIEDDSGP